MTFLKLEIFDGEECRWSYAFGRGKAFVDCLPTPLACKKARVVLHYRHSVLKKSSTNLLDVSSFRREIQHSLCALAGAEIDPAQLRAKGQAPYQCGSRQGSRVGEYAIAPDVPVEPSAALGSRWPVE